MGDAIPRVASREVEVSRARHILCNHSQPWDAHLFHDSIAYTLLVWAFRPRERVSPVQCCATCNLTESLAWSIFLPRASSSVVSSRTSGVFLGLYRLRCNGLPCQVLLLLNMAFLPPIRPTQFRSLSMRSTFSTPTHLYHQRSIFCCRPSPTSTLLLSFLAGFTVGCTDFSMSS